MRLIQRHTAAGAVALGCALGAGGCKKAANPLAGIETARITKQDIVVSVEATGVIQPVDAVQVKSKASGQIIKMPIVVGQHVRAGELLVQVDPRQMQSQYDAAQAALRAAQANLASQITNLAREDSLLRQGVITHVEYDAAVVAQANAESAVASAKTSVEVSSINLADCTVLSPIDGTVIDKSVAVGQVIASATNIVGGGTTLVTVADLGNVLDSALVNESDIGHVAIGQDVAVTVSAFTNRTFDGKVLRISPAAIVQQSVTMFPVLVSLSNREGLLLPGMSTDATIEISKVVGAVAIPNDAVGSLSDARTLSPVLGIPTTAVDSTLRGLGTGRATGGRAAGARGESTGVVLGRGRGAAPATTVAPETAAASRPGVVFVLDSATQTFSLRVVQIGTGNYEITRAISGVQPGERVALLSDVRMAATRDTTLQRIQGRAGISGVTGAGGGGGRGGGGGGRGND